MTNEKAGTRFLEENIIISLRRQQFGTFLYSSDPNLSANNQEQDNNNHMTNRKMISNAKLDIPSRQFLNGWSSPRATTSPEFIMSPWNNHASPYIKSPWTYHRPSSLYDNDDNDNFPSCRLIGSLVRKEGHIYSLAASGDLLYTGSDSKNIRVWKNLKEFSGFKSNSGLVKAIIIKGNKIFTGHQDGKIRVWKFSGNKRKVYERIGSLPTTKDYVKSSMNPKSYVEVKRNRNLPWIRHFDVVSCMSLDEEQGLLYSGSWDKTLKIWRISDSKCLESIKAHDDAVNSVVVGFNELVFTGSTDGTVKVWKREFVGKEMRHCFVQTLLKHGNAVTSLAVNRAARVVYSGSSDGLVNFWEQGKGRCLSHGGVLRGHKMAVLCLAAAGNLIVSGSADKTICVWLRKEQECGFHFYLTVLTGHGGPVKCLALEEDFEMENDPKVRDQRWIVYSGSLDKSVKVWRVTENFSSALRQLKGVRK